MFITKKHIARRTVLKGAGAALALPFLEAMVPAATALAQTAANPKPRFVGCFVPHGMAPGYWVPEKEGKDFTYPFCWKPLEPFRDQATIMSGLHSRSAEPPPGVTGADHWVAAAFLCAALVLYLDGQVIAAAFFGCLFLATAGYGFITWAKYNNRL